MPEANQHANPHLLVRSVSSDFDVLMEQGLAASRREELEAALTAWRSAARTRPDSALPHFLMGAELAQAQRLDEAEAAFANAVLLAPGFETARYQLGLLQFTSGRAAMALVTWEPLLQLATVHPIRLFVEGFAALARDDFDEALERFRAGMALNRDNAPMNGDIAQVVAAIERRPAPAATAEPAITEPADFHVLVSAYREQGPLH